MILIIETVELNVSGHDVKELHYPAVVILLNNTGQTSSLWRKFGGFERLVMNLRRICG